MTFPIDMNVKVSLYYHEGEYHALKTEVRNSFPITKKVIVMVYKRKV